MLSLAFPLACLHNMNVDSQAIVPCEMEKQMATEKTRDRAVRSREELQRASLAIQHEMVNLAIAHQMLQLSPAHRGSPPQDQAMSNALLTSFLVAARNLLSFLYAHNPRTSDIIAEDFVDEPNTWAEYRPVLGPDMADGELVGLISKRLAHLTWDRASSTKPLWGAFKIAWSIGLAMQSFLRLVDEAKTHPQLHQDVAAIMADIGTQVNQSHGLMPSMAPAQELMQFDDIVYFGRSQDPGT